MATVFWKGKQWVAQWYQPGGKRVKRGTGCAGGRRDAERIANEMEAKDRRQKDDTGRKYEEIISRAGADARARRLSADRAAEYLTELRQVSDPAFKVVTLEAYLSEWCDGKTHLVGEKTAALYADAKRRFTAALGAAAMRSPIGDLTKRQVEGALVKIKETGVKGSTANLDLKSLRQALKHAQEEGIVAKNVAATVQPLPEDDSSERAPFTADEVRGMIDHDKTSDEWRGMILFGGHTGLRLGDVAQLGREHVDGTDLVIRPTKTKRTRKVIRIPMTPPLLAWIDGRKGRFFLDLATKATSTLSMQFTAIMKRASVPATVTLPGGITAKRSFHSLRHSFTSWLAEGDIHADVRQRLTGHSSAREHAKYSHHDKALEAAIRVLPDFTGKPPAKRAKKRAQSAG